MGKTKHITAPLGARTIAGLEAGEMVSLSGTIYTARDQAHLRLSKLISSGKKLPVDIKGQIFYYCGPTPAPPDKPIGSCGPTTSGRMDAFTPAVLGAGLKGMIGKGRRSEKVRESVKKNKAVYFLAPAGAGAYLNAKVTSCKVVAFEELGPEAIYRLEVKDFPLIVGIDARG
ncbi:MAG: FumA C-terminus/TtdB family hydratase beta subunit, partial [Candidatus Omnitrophica bacterium]|nr:FumA C-terminus/TtdB family hydratase beta subunit [Candidatus Omnitrophota bacterium]